MVRRPDPAQARGPQPHRRAQDPQRARPGPAHQADGQDPGDRRDRGRPARRRLGDRGGLPRAGVRGLHGRGRHRAAGPQRRPDAAARRRGGLGEVRHPHAQGRDQRGDARLGRQRRPHALPDRYGGRAAPVPGDGPRLPPRSSATRPGPSAWSCTAGCRTRPSPVSAAAPTRSGMFAAFVDDAEVRLYGFEAGGDGVETGRHAATISAGEVGVLHGARTYVLQDEDGQTIESHSISAGLDYPGVGPEHAWLAETGRATYRPITDAEAMDAFALLSRTEGIIPAIESAHALAGAMRARPQERPGRRPSWSTCPAAATRTWTPRSSGSAWARPSADDGRARAAREVGNTAGEPRHEPAGLRRGEGRGSRPRSSATCRPASPTSTGPSSAMRAMVDGRLRRDRGRAALQRPGDGRPDDPGRRPAGAGGRHPHRRRARAPSRRSPRPARPTLVMTYWNPVERYGVDAVRRRPGQRRGSRADHARPDARRGRRAGSPPPTRTAWTRSSWSRRPRPTSGCG